MANASNAFNNLDHKVALVNIYHSCPCFATILINTYRQESALYIDGETMDQCRTKLKALKMKA